METNPTKTTTHVQREKQTTQSQTTENLIFDQKQIERMTTKQLRQQTTLRGIPIMSRKRKHFTTARNLNSIYTHDRNMKKKRLTQKNAYTQKLIRRKSQIRPKLAIYKKSFHTSPPHIKTTNFNENLPVSYSPHPHLQNLRQISPQITIFQIKNKSHSKQPQKPKNNH